MSDIFLSHVQEDFPVVGQLADALEAAGYSTWYYERDADLPGIPHPLQTRQAIQDANAFLLIISPGSLAQPQHVRREVMRAVDLDKPFVPLLHDVSFEEFVERQPAWYDALAGAVATPIQPEDPTIIVPRIVASLKHLGIEPGGSTEGGIQPEAPAVRMLWSGEAAAHGGPDVVLSYVEEDSAVSARLADTLEAERYISWFYERDGMLRATVGENGGTLPPPSASEHTSPAVDEAPVVRLTNQLISEAIEERASEVHVEPTSGDLRVQFRVGGELREVMRLPKNVQAGLLSRVKIMADIDIAESRLPQQGRLGLKVGGTEADFRVATYPAPQGEKVVIRIMDRAAPIKNIPRAKVVIALISPGSLDSDRFIEEIEAARAADKPIVPVLIEMTAEQLSREPRWPIHSPETDSVAMPPEGIGPALNAALRTALSRLGIEPSGRMLEVVLGDITEQDVDVIVNAANPTLMGGGGVDGAIHRKGGPQILRECRLIRREEYPGGMPPGKAVATTAGELPATWVIHTVGPVYSESEDRSHLLASSYREALRVADKLGASSVAFPAISTGAFGYPVQEAAVIAIRAVKDVETKVGLIRLVLFDRATYEAFEQALGDA